MEFSKFSSNCKRLTLSGIVLLLCTSRGATGQTEKQLEMRLKKVLAFEIRPGIEVFPTFAENGSVCRIVVEKRQYLDAANADFEVTIPSTLTNELTNELVPADERGKPVSPYLSSESFVAGGASFIKKDYENVSISTYGSSVEGKASGVNVIIISWPKRTCVSGR